MKILLVDNGTTLLNKLKTLIPGQVVQKWNEIDLNSDIDYDCLVLSGSSRFSVIDQVDVLQKEVELIKKFNGPIIGICFGAELIAYSYGGTLVRIPEKKGVFGVSVVKDDPIFNGHTWFDVYEHHRWSIQSLSPDFEILALSETGIEMYKHKERPVYGLQFHPEHLTESTWGDEIFTSLFSHLAL